MKTMICRRRLKVEKLVGLLQSAFNKAIVANNAAGARRAQDFLNQARTIQVQSTELTVNINQFLKDQGVL